MDSGLDKRIVEELVLLFVEDEVLTASMFIKTLKRRFKEVYLACNGNEGIELFNRYKPDIVLTDILMPKMNGIEMIAAIKEIAKQTPIIVMSAVSELNYIERAKELGIQDYLIKPIQSEEFFSVLKRITSDLITQKRK
ncbi:MAG: response regulator [Candidatus Magnetoovum sp. WYHC-5]|nr:response regulator [Candidatus Magnetoovum sp. WYHC-5]